MAGLVWKIDSSEQGWVFVRLSGGIDEDARLDRLAGELAGQRAVRLDLADVVRINSCGVREWVRFMRSIPRETKLTLESCSPIVVSQVNMISNFAGHAHIVSVKAPFACTACGYEEDVVIAVKGQPPQFPKRVCPKCAKPQLMFDDVESSYFAFMAAAS